MSYPIMAYYMDLAIPQENKIGGQQVVVEILDREL